MPETTHHGPIDNRRCSTCGGPIYARVVTEDYGRRDAYFYCGRNDCEITGHDPKKLPSV